MLLPLLLGSIILTATANENQDGGGVAGNDNVTAKDADKMPDNKNSDKKTPDQNTDKIKIDETKQQPKNKKNTLIEEIRELIQKLGDESFVVREHAGKRLLQIGIAAEPELQRAVKNNDTEISLRATMLLSQLEQVLRDSGDEAVEIYIKIYSNEIEPTIKLSCIWQLANPLPDSFKDGEGLQSLCRIVRFDKDKIMRNEAAKCLIALSPFALSSCEKWYQNMHRLFNKSDEEPVFKLIYDFASLRIELNNLRKKTETEIENRANKSGEPVEYPIKLPKSKEIEDRLHKFVADLNKFQNDPLYSKIKPGHWIDILVFYAAAEMYDELGMNQERDKILEKTLTIREKSNLNRPPMILSELENKKMNEHYRAAIILHRKQRLNWTERHLKLVIEEGDLLLKINACNEAAMVRHIMSDLSGAIAYFEKSIEVAKSEEYMNNFNDSTELTQKNKTQILAYQAQLAVDNEDWVKAKELVDKTLELNPYEIDTIILRHKICEHSPNIDTAYKALMRSIIEKATLSIRQELDGRTHNDPSRFYAHVACNQVAWLLANTNGEFTLARDLIEVTMKYEPDSSTYLDTQAHVFVLGKQFDKAIEIQTKAIKLSPEAKLYRDALKRFKKLKDNVEIKTQ
jgi:tetratricopeptide (TPR) repeat protein